MSKYRKESSGLVTVPALCDLHVHFRQPGYEYKETILSGSTAAARGGYSLVCTMPNLNPVPDSIDTLSVEQNIIDKDAVIDVRPYCSITKGRKGVEIVDFEALKDKCCAFSDDGCGVQNDSVMKEAMRQCASLGAIIAAHCEVNSLLKGGYVHDGKWCREHGHKGICSESEWAQIDRDLNLAASTGVHYHVCHISCKESVELIRQAKRSGVRVTCETGPHYLVLCEDDLQEHGRFKMNPPLRAASDREALLEGILDGTIDCIATDHAPHSALEKSKGLAHSAMGVVGLECAFAVLYTNLVEKGIMSLDRLVELMSDNPRRIFSLPSEGQATFDLDRDWVIEGEKFVSKGKFTPFEGSVVRGECVRTEYKGKTVYEK